MLFIAVLVVAAYVGEAVTTGLGYYVRPSTEPVLHRMLMTAMVIYVCLMMFPFVPAIEIGLALMLVFGAAIVPLVYLATVVALILSFLLGRLIPQQTVIDLLDLVRLRRARDLLARLQPLDSQGRLELLLQHVSSRWLLFLVRNRYLAAAVAINTPGNAIIGGGGGIGLAAGFSRLFSLPKYALTIALAVMPFPLAVWITGA